MLSGSLLSLSSLALGLAAVSQAHDHYIKYERISYAMLAFISNYHSTNQVLFYRQLHDRDGLLLTRRAQHQCLDFPLCKAQSTAPLLETNQDQGTRIAQREGEA